MWRACGQRCDFAARNTGDRLPHPDELRVPARIIDISPGDIPNICRECPHRFEQGSRAACAASIVSATDGRPGRIEAIRRAYVVLNEFVQQGQFDPRMREDVRITARHAISAMYHAPGRETCAQLDRSSSAKLDFAIAGHSNDCGRDVLLAFTRALVTNLGAASPSDLTALREAGHDNSAIIETVLNVAMAVVEEFLAQIASEETSQCSHERSARADADVG